MIFFTLSFLEKFEENLRVWIRSPQRLFNKGVAKYVLFDKDDIYLETPPIERKASVPLKVPIDKEVDYLDSSVAEDSFLEWVGIYGHVWDMKYLSVVGQSLLKIKYEPIYEDLFEGIVYDDV